MKCKKGITTISLVVYVILLFAFITLALNVSRNLNNGMYEDKGMAINLSNLDKAMYYLNKSTLESNNLIVENNTLTFSNGDIYSYDAVTKTLYYNDGILVDNMSAFSISTVKDNEYEINLKLISYSSEMTRNIRLFVGE